MKLDIKPISQRDPAHANKKLGFRAGKIGRWGCLLTVHTCLLNYYGKDFTVDSLNEFYKSKKVFDGNLINYWAAANCWDDITAEDDINNYYDVPCDMEKIDKYLSERKPIIAGIGASPTSPKDLVYDRMIDHFVIIIGKDEQGELIIMDPFFGEVYFFSAKYGDPTKYIFGLRAYNGPVPQENGDSKEAMRAENKRLREQLVEEGQLITDLRGDLFKMERDEASDEIELTELRERNRKLELDAGRLKKAQERILELEVQQKALKVRLVALEKTKVEKLSTKQITDLLIKRIFRR